MKLLNVSINLSKVDKQRLVKGEKGVYLIVTLAVNDEKDQYDNDVSAWQSQTKEEREAKAERNWLGNGRVVYSSDSHATPSAEETSFMDLPENGSKEAAPQSPTQALPF